jgi:hypothetical protein
MVTFKKTQTGVFEVLENNEKTCYLIQNGMLGCSGHGVNLYGILNTSTDKVTWIGSLQAAKKAVGYWLKVKK